MAERKANRLPLENYVPTGRCWQAGWLCFGVMAAALLLAVWNIARAEIALVRLVDPFGTHAWPTKTRIEVLSPTFPARIAKGDVFEINFAVRGELSAPATVRLRVKDGGESEEQFPLSPSNDSKYPGAALVTARFDSTRVSSSFEIRISSNDAETDWLEVTVVPPPRLVLLDGRPSPQFHATPPAYTNLASGQLPDGAAVLEVPTGTMLRFRAATDVPVSAAKLEYEGDRSAVLNGAPVAFIGQLNPLAALGGQQLADVIGADIPLAISEEGTRLAVDFIPPLSGTYALRMTDHSGLTGTRLIEIRLIPDPVPNVILARPLAGIDPPLLTPAASVPVRTIAEDKLYGVRVAYLEYRIGRDGPLQEMPLVRAANPLPSALAAVAGGWVQHTLPSNHSVESYHLIPIQDFRRPDGSLLQEGDLLILRAAACDWDDVAQLKGRGRSLTQFEIRIASSETIDAWLQRELATFRPELIRLREQQRDAKEKVGDVQARPSDDVSQADRDKLVTAEHIQRQLRARIADQRDGLRARAELLLATVKANQLKKPNTTDRIKIVAEELGRMADRDLGTIEQNIANARQLLALPTTPEQKIQFAEFLRKTTRHQKNVEDTATALLDLLSQWGGAGEIRGEARVLRDAILRQLQANEQLKDRVPEGKDKLSAEEQRELDRAAVQIDQSAEQAGQLVARAARLAAEKDKIASDLREQAAAKEELAKKLRLQAAESSNPVEKSSLNVKADAAAATAADLKRAAAKASAEADALRKGLNAAGGQELAEMLRQSAELLRANRQGESASKMQSAVDRLDALAKALAENTEDAVPELAKPKNLKNAADQLDALAAAQDELRKKAEEAARITDPEKRKAAFQELAKEQEHLIERGRELLQKLTRDRAEDAARDTRNAIDKMEAARDDLEQGIPPSRAQSEAVDRLDDARDRLDVAAEQAGRQLADEKRRKLADMVKSLVERQQAALTEANRIHAEMLKAKQWDRLLLTSYADLESIREQEIAIEIRKLAETEFASYLVLTRLLNDAAKAIDSAREIIKQRCDDADLAEAFDEELETETNRKVLRLMMLAQRRLEHLAAALKPDEMNKPKDKNDGMPQAEPNPGGAVEQDVVPPLAQLKVLRALQAELNDRTAEFAKANPDPDKLTAAQKAELKELEAAQREIAELFEEIAKMLNKSEMPQPDNGIKPEEKP